MALSSIGIGSGLPVDDMVSQLMALERRPIALVQTAKTKLSSQLSSIGLLQSHLSNIQSSATQLAGADFWTKNTATSSDSAVTVSARASAQPATYTIEVTSLATSQSLSSGVITDPQNVGTGTLTITRGGTDVTIDIGADDASLEKIRDKINGADAGVTAAIIKDSSGSRLVLTGTETGAANAVSIGVTNATGELAGLAYPGGLTESRAAADAVLKVNGLAVTSAGNKLENVIDGLDLTLTKATTEPLTVTVRNDTAALRKGIEAFITNYNAANSFLSAQTKYDETTKTAGALQGDRTAVGLQNKLRSLVSQGSAASSMYGRLSDMGIALQRDGSLKIEDEKKLTAALANPAELSKAFTTPTTGIAHGFKALADGMVGMQGSLTTKQDSLREGVKRKDRDIERLEDRVARKEAMLLKQYQALDAKMNQLNGLSTYVTQQMTMLNSMYTRDK